MWTYPEWPLWGSAQPAPRRPSAVEQVLSRVRHPSFTPDVADELVRNLSRPALRRLWKATERILEETSDDDLRFRVVVFRERLLDQLNPVPDQSSTG
jgi:hypothetical protein